MEQAKQDNAIKKVKFGLKSFLVIVAILLAINILVGILTYVIPSGTYNYYVSEADGNGVYTDNPNLVGKAVPDSYHLIESSSRLPVWRWFTAPFEAVAVGEGNVTVILIIVIILVLGGTFAVLDDSGAIVALVRLLISKLGKRKYLAIWIITLVIMLLASFFGLQEELLILIPVFMAFASAMNWSKVTALTLVLVTSGVGFTAALFNPFTVGQASMLAGVEISSGLWYRIIVLAVLYVLTCLFLTYTARKEEKSRISQGLTASGMSLLDDLTEEEKVQDTKKARLTAILFGAVVVIMILSVTIPFLADLGLTMPLMGVAFLIGAFVTGSIMNGSFARTGKSFLRGIIDIAPSIVIILLAFSVKYIAECGDILHTIFYYINGAVIRLNSPYLGVILLYFMVLVIEFFIPSSTSKALLLIPLLTITPIAGISTNIIILAYLFGDGYANILFPTCGTLVIGLSLADVSYVDWLKRTGLFQLGLMAVSIGFLCLGVLIGI